MFYDLKNKSLKYDDIFLKDVKIQNEEGEIDAQDTYFLSACDDKLLKELGFAKVKEEIPSFNEKIEELRQIQTYDEENNLYIISYKIKEKALEELKELKLEELKAIKEEKLLFMPFKNTIFQIDTEAKINISGKVSEIMLANLNNTPLENIAWIDKDNKITTFNKEEFLEFGVGIAKYTESIIFKNDELRNKVKNATSLEELNLIAWESEK
ncbi:TPA: DUF4376 domain-containing protein [Campylobacter jejuni]|uniref:DUF4376 domain-containing protein n=1 Tax=Campylobacter jejuni TaxID=197 RepID=A0A5T2ADF4_CAMJU|nr:MULTISPECIES: DUF4376 domain-containing protein [Campylobacter]AHN82833.1 hypothetical protein 00-0949_00033 [Campylobacter phage CJIE4-1]EAI5634110.1 DUF4376 domain-containing protein [Campylobacter coli]AJK85166.1 hypothetical protein PJ16_07075 [Campylobacter jejuni subsp. jejuni]APA46924.1 hypothetical protein BLD42_02555 [Campylobacter jejuni]APB39149.1 hypothetical protein BLD40_02810 [Campylobacter jejuni]